MNKKLFRKKTDKKSDLTEREEDRFFVIDKEHPTRGIAKKAVRGSVYLLIGLLLVSGLRSWFKPVDSGDGGGFNDQSVVAIAERFTGSYLNFDEDDPQFYIDNIALDTLKSGLSSSWDGKGKQDADSVSVISIEQLNNEFVLATASAFVTPYSRADKKSPWKNGESFWASLQFQIFVAGSTPVVVGSPGFTSIATTPNKISESELPKLDNTINQELTKLTKTDAENFFLAFARDRDLATITAPGASIEGLSGTLTFIDLSSWTVLEREGGEENVKARASVTLENSVGTKFTQNYELELVEVGAGASSKLQVLSLTGGGR